MFTTGTLEEQLAVVEIKVRINRLDFCLKITSSFQAHELLAVPRTSTVGSVKPVFSEDALKEFVMIGHFDRDKSTGLQSMITIFNVEVSIYDDKMLGFY